MPINEKKIQDTLIKNDVIDDPLSREKPFFKILDNKTNEIDEKWYNYTFASDLVDKTIIIDDKYWQKYKEFVNEEEKQDFYKLLLLIQNYLYDEFDIYQFFSENEDFSDFGLLFSTYDIEQDNDYYQEYIDTFNLDNDNSYEYEIQISLNLYSKELSIYYDNVIVSKEKYESYSDLIDFMNGCDFNSLYSKYHEDYYLQKLILKSKFYDLNERYPTGTEIVLYSSKYDEQSIPYGSKGIVLFVDENEHIYIEWENKIQSYILEDFDDFKICNYNNNILDLDTPDICI